MQKIVFALFICFSISSTVSISQNRSIEFNHGTWTEILAQAKKENKMIYVDCYTSWCGPCKWMAKNVFTNDTVADFYNKNFINVKIDMENGEGLEIAAKYDIRAYPIMLFLNAFGEQLHRTCGSTPAQNFVAIGKSALVPDQQLATFSKTFNTQNVNASFAFTYFSMLENACQSYGAELAKYFSTQKEEDLRSKSNWKLIFKYVDEYNSKPFLYLESNKGSFAKLYSLDSVEMKINQVYTSGLYSALQNNDSVGYETLKVKLKRSDTKDADKIISEADIKKFQRKKDWANYSGLVTDYIQKYDAENANDLNSYAWTFYENIDDKRMLEKAAGWAKKATELDDNYPYNDTYAAVLYKSGNYSEAKKIAEKAIALAKKNGDDYKETEALLVKIKAAK
jgi:thiol-disulfide isomerase/thioredoxin